MTSYYTDHQFAPDPWASRAILDGPAWLEQRADFPATETLALSLEPGFNVEALAADVARFDLIKIRFPKFTDGRGYSMGWLLRARLGYVGQMRATGDVLFDEMQLMRRCGFDAFDIADQATEMLLRKGRRPGMVDRFYQPGLDSEIPAGTRPWARRPSAEAGT